MEREPKTTKPMYPVFLDIEGERCIVVGGGKVAERKVEKLLECGAAVTVVAPEATERIDALALQHKLLWEKREYRDGEACGYFLAIAATNIKDLNERVSADARAAGRPVNVVDVPTLCNFYVPSVLRRGDLQIAVSTAGASPSIAKKVRETLEPLFPETYEKLLERLRRFRIELHDKIPEESRRMEIYAEVAGSPEVESYLEGDFAPLEALIKKCV